MQLPVKSHRGSLLLLAQTITLLEEISYDFIQIKNKWPLFTSDKHTHSTLHTSITYQKINCKSITTKLNQRCTCID